MPIFAASSMNSQGVSSRSSHSCGDRAHRVDGETVDPLLDRLLVVVQFHREVAIASSLSGRRGYR